MKFWVILQWVLSMARENKTFSDETFLREFYICSPFLHNLLQISKNFNIFSFQQAPRMRRNRLLLYPSRISLRRIHRGSEMYRIRSFPVFIRVPQVQPGKHTWKAFPRHLVFEIWPSREALADLRGLSVLSYLQHRIALAVQELALQTRVHQPLPPESQD